MKGFSGVEGQEDGVFSDNASFDGTQRGGFMTTNGQLWIGSTAARHVKLGSITSPLGTLSIGYSSPNITLDSLGTLWSDKSTSFSAITGNGYVVNGLGVTASLPSSPSNGDTISFIAIGVTFIIQASAGKSIRIGLGTSGSNRQATNNSSGDSVKLVWISTQSQWIATSVIGTWILS